MTPTPEELDALVTRMKADFPSWQRTWTEARLRELATEALRWPRPGKRVAVTPAQIEKLREQG